MLSSSDTGRASPSRVAERSSSWVLNARVNPPVLSGVAARDAGRASGEERSRLGWLSRRLRRAGLYLSKLARVGDANEGRLVVVPARGGASRGVVVTVDSDSGWMGMAVRGEVLRLFGAEVSMVIQLGVWLSAHGRILSRREVPGYDASNCDFGFVLLLELEGGEQWMFCLERGHHQVSRTVRVLDDTVCSDN